MEFRHPWGWGQAGEKGHGGMGDGPLGLALAPPAMDMGEWGMGHWAWLWHPQLLTTNRFILCTNGTHF